MKLEKPNFEKPFFKMFPKIKKIVENNKCPVCENDIKEEDFENDLSKKEYSISGLCQTCQNKVFKGNQNDKTKL